MRYLFGLLLIASCAHHGLLHAESNWHRWRGPEANGSSATANPPVHWGPDQNIKWKVEIPGKGSSTPIISGNRVLVLTAIKTDRIGKDNLSEGESSAGQFGTQPMQANLHQFVLLCYDRETGKELWRSVAAEAVPHERGHQTNTFASSSPVTDGENIFVSFGSHGVHCFNMDGRPIWKRDFGKMRTRAGFGEASSPALHGDKLVVPWDHEDESFIAALDTKTGDVLWKTARDERTTWATPLIVEHKGRHQVITNGMTVRSYDLETGDLIWECGGQVSNPIPSPVVLGDTVYCMTGYRGNAIQAISLDSVGDVSDSADVIWERRDAAPYVPSPSLYEGRLYVTKGFQNVVFSLDAVSGDPVIEQQRVDGIRNMYASPVSAAGRVYFTSREGTTVVIRHGDQYEVLATNELGEPIDASPAIVDDQLFLRSDKHLYCIVEP